MHGNIGMCIPYFAFLDVNIPLNAAALRPYNIMFCRVEPRSENSQATATAFDIATETEGKLLLSET
jgi:hypothetical protein